MGNVLLLPALPNNSEGISSFSKWIVHRLEAFEFSRKKRFQHGIHFHLYERLVSVQLICPTSSFYSELVNICSGNYIQQFINYFEFKSDVTINKRSVGSFCFLHGISLTNTHIMLPPTTFPLKLFVHTSLSSIFCFLCSFKRAAFFVDFRTPLTGFGKQGKFERIFEMSFMMHKEISARNLTQKLKTLKY